MFSTLDLVCRHRSVFGPCSEDDSYGAPTLRRLHVPPSRPFTRVQTLLVRSQPVSSLISTMSGYPGYGGYGPPASQPPVGYFPYVYPIPSDMESRPGSLEAPLSQELPDIRLDARSDTDKPRPNTQPQMVPPFSGYSQAPVPAIPPPGTFPPPHPSFGYPMQPPAPFTGFAPPVRSSWTPD